MEAQLFELMRANGYGGAYIDRFRMMSAFHQQRMPLLVLISGATPRESLLLPLHAAASPAAAVGPARPSRRPTCTACAAGTGCIGKSILATQLAERLNLPNIVQTDWIHTLLSPDLVFPDPTGSRDTRVWRRRFASEDELIREYEREAVAVRHAIDADIHKAQTDGKVRARQSSIV